MEHFIRDDEGNWRNQYGISFRVTEKVPQEILPAEDRIPNEIEGVRVYITESWNYSAGRAVQYQKPPEIHYAYAVIRKHEDMLLRQPNRTHVPLIGVVGDGGRPGEPLSVRIVVYVTEKVDQSALPPADRIPDCLEGIPVVIDDNKPDSE